jgi:hypothetical protein
MILHHFTAADVAAIEAEGLKPGADSWRDWTSLLGMDTPKENVVWLTTLPNLVFRWNPLPTHRLTVVVPSRDRRLVLHATLLRKCGIPTKNIFDHIRNPLSSYIYYGSIPPEQITEIAEIAYQLTDFDDDGVKTFKDLTGLNDAQVRAIRSE